jgi:hypothetical protein
LERLAHIVNPDPALAIGWLDQRQVGMIAMRELAAGGALATRLQLAWLAALAERGLRQRHRQGEFADARWAMQQIGMAQTSASQRTLQRGLRLSIPDDSAHRDRSSL